MGGFLAISGVIGKTKAEVIDSLTKYAIANGGGLEQADNIKSEQNRCVVDEANGNISVLYPQGYVEWDSSSEFISRDLNATVFSFHVHDGDLWMYVLYHGGEIVDQFNPIPDYWDDSLSEEELSSWNGNADVVAKYHSDIQAGNIEKYLVRWSIDGENETAKAYQTDQYGKEDWQLIDFMSKLKIPAPIDDNWNPKGQTYQFWTTQLMLESEPAQMNNKQIPTSKPWWKFW